MNEGKVGKPEDKLGKPEKPTKVTGSVTPGPTSPQPVSTQSAIDLYRSIQTALEGSNPEWLLPT